MLPSQIIPTAARPTARHRHVWCLPGLVVVLALVLAGCGGQAPSARPTPPPLTPTPTIVPPVVYVALGASDAVGVGAANPNTQGYVPLLIARLPKGSQALNLGISGAQLHDALTSELPSAVDAHPTLVTVWLAGNDFRACVPLQQYAADLETLLGTLQSQTSAHVFVANLPDMSLLPAFQGGAPGAGACFSGASAAQIRALVVQWNDAIDAAVARHADVLVDLFNAGLAAHPEFIYSDGFHPSTKGYAALADLFWIQIQAHGAVPKA